jgi:hypothetical protein
MMAAMSRFTTPLQRAMALLAQQFGAIGHDQARDCGLTEGQIRTLAGHGTWVRATRGVSVAAASVDSPQRRATVAWLSTRRGDGVLSFVTAAWVHGLLGPSPLPHVTVRPGASPRSPVARIHRSRIPPEDRVRRWRMTATNVSRTIVDLAPVLERRRYEEVIDAAFCQKLATPESVDRCLARMGRGHTAAEITRAALATWNPVIEPGSAAEMRLVRLVAELGLTGLVCQHEVRTPDGFVARLDLAAPALQRGLEYDGVLAHNPRRWDRDEPRYERLRALGWSIESVTKADLLPGETRLRELVARWLAAGAA